MPHTPLLRSVARLAREQRIARLRGLPVEAVRADATQRRAEAPLGRRAFLAGAAAAAGVLAAPRPARASGQPRIAVVGGGVAGLAAALKLRDAGVEATVYEAAGRVGGRMFSNTDYFDQGQVFEWCGELIDTPHVTIQRLAARFGLGLDNLHAAQPEGSEETYYFDGHYYPRADAERDLLAIQDVIELDLTLAGYPTTYNQSTPHGRWLDSISVHDWIALRVPGGHHSRLGKLLDTAYFIELNSDTRDQSALNILYLLGFQEDWGDFEMYGASDETFHIRGGNQQIPRAIAAHLGPETVKLGHRMESIVRRPRGDYDLTFRRGGNAITVLADVVILTLPFAVLRGLDYRHAGFDARKHLAIQELGRGRQSKQHLQFTRRLWNERGPKPAPGTGTSYADTGYQATWETSRAQPGTDGILVGYCGAAFADAMSTTVPFATAVVPSVRADARRFLAQAEPVFPGLSAHFTGKSTQGLPHLDPNMGCSYSYWRVGQCHTIAGYEGVRQGNVFFAGEHTSVDFQGFMEGGASSGESAAAEILADLGRG